MPEQNEENVYYHKVCQSSKYICNPIGDNSQMLISVLRHLTVTFQMEYVHLGGYRDG